MNLKPELKSVMDALGVTPDELVMLQGRMMSSVTSLQAQITALDAQISTLNGQRSELAAELAAANVTLAKLADAR